MHTTQAQLVYFGAFLKTSSFIAVLFLLELKASSILYFWNYYLFIYIMSILRNVKKHF